MSIFYLICSIFTLLIAGASIYDLILDFFLSERLHPNAWLIIINILWIVFLILSSVFQLIQYKGTL